MTTVVLFIANIIIWRAYGVMVKRRKRWHS